MSQIILHAEGMSIKLLDFEYLISKKADDNGYPYGGGALKYVIAGVEATKDITFFEYALSHTRFIPKIVFEIKPTILGQQKTRYITIYDAHIMRFKSHFCDYSPQPMTETFFITAQGMEQSHSTTIYSTPFRKTFENNNVKSIASDDTKEEVIDCYLTDLEGNENPYLEVGKDIYLVIKTANLAGQTKDIDVANFGVLFSYNDQVLDGNMLNGFNISKDLHKVKLKVVKSLDTASLLED